MKPSQYYFQQNKYVIIDNMLDPKACSLLTQYLTNITKDMKEGDTQCPISPSIYGDPIFDTLLLDLKPAMEDATGLSLVPTYSYARFYKPGDELKPHVDRKECEISATITLGYSGNVWPIHVSATDDPADDLGAIALDVGCAVAYRGMEINHWREKYVEGDWQCQVFLHYVDANGPYKDLKYDGRKEVGTKKREENIQARKEYDETYWYFGNKQHEKFLWLFKENMLSEGLIDLIVEYGNSHTGEASIGYGSTEKIDKTVRNANVAVIHPEKFEWLYKILEKEIGIVNLENYRFVLDKIELLSYIEYHGGIESPGKYEKHTDGAIHMTRKLSFSILLSDPSEYEGGDLLIHDLGQSYLVPKKKGSIAFFPSYTEHEVTPVTKGVRKSLVGWIHGPHFT